VIRQDLGNRAIGKADNQNTPFEIDAAQRSREKIAAHRIVNEIGLCSAIILRPHSYAGLKM